VRVGAEALTLILTWLAIKLAFWYTNHWDQAKTRRQNFQTLWVDFMQFSAPHDSKVELASVNNPQKTNVGKHKATKDRGSGPTLQEPTVMSGALEPKEPADERSTTEIIDSITKGKSRGPRMSSPDIV
jgi:hypothetical protein